LNFQVPELVEGRKNT